MFQAVDQDRSEPLIRADGQISSIRADCAGPDVCAEAERLYMHAACTGTEIAELLQPVLQTEPEQGTQIQLVAADTVDSFPVRRRAERMDRAIGRRCAEAEQAVAVFERQQSVPCTDQQPSARHRGLCAGLRQILPPRLMGKPGDLLQVGSSQVLRAAVFIQLRECTKLCDRPIFDL